MFIKLMNQMKWIGFIIVLVSIRTIQSEGSAVVLTPNHLAYNFYPMNKSSLSVKIRAPQDAHILLTSQPNDSNPAYEIFLGGWKNTKSAIRLNHTRPERKMAVSKGILSATEFRGFWVSWKEGMVSVGKEGDAVPFLLWTNPEPFEVRYYGIRTAWGATGEWIIEDPSVFRAQVDQYDFHIGLPGFVAVHVVASTTPALVWKVHNYTISEGNFDPDGLYHATRAYMESIGNWEARLVIFNVTSDDIAEEILLTSRIRGQLGSNTYHINLYPSNNTLVAGDGTNCLTQTSANTTAFPMSSVFSDNSNESMYKPTTMNADLQTSLVSIISDVERELLDCYNFKNISRNDTLAATGILGSNTTQNRELTTVSLKIGNNSLNTSKKIVKATTPKIVVDNNSKTITPETMASFFIKNITKYITKIPLNSTLKYTTKTLKLSSKGIQTVKPSTSLPGPATRTYLTTTNANQSPVTAQTDKSSRIMTGKTAIDITKMSSWSTKAWRIGSKTTQSMDTLQRQLQCLENEGKTRPHLIVIGVLVMVIVVIVSLIGKATYKYKKMTGTWWFKAKFHSSIPMEDIHDGENNSLIH